jgi:hypothetical protein
MSHEQDEADPTLDELARASNALSRRVHRACELRGYVLTPWYDQNRALRTLMSMRDALEPTTRRRHD